MTKEIKHLLIDHETGPTKLGRELGVTEAAIRRVLAGQSRSARIERHVARQLRLTVRELRRLIDPQAHKRAA